MTFENAVILFLFLFAIKHFVIDFLLQREYQWRNKGIYGHWGGLEHSGLHFLGSFVILSMFTSLDLSFYLALFDGVVHYHIDWAKVQINQRKGWKPDTNPEFWWLLGFDQFLHFITYFVILYFLIQP